MENLLNKKVLVVDDNDVIHIYYKALLKPYGVHLLHAYGGREAIDLYKNNHDIDLVLMDLRMPHMSGQEALEEILQYDPSAKVVAQTAFLHEEERHKFLQMGFYAYFTKPVSEETIFETLGSVD